MEPAPLHLEDAARLPGNLRFGTSSWIYPGWKGLVYRDYYPTEQDFRAHCLREYARFPWFRTVGIDGSYYAPPKPEQLRRYAALLPAGFPWVSKVWQEVTVARFPEHARFKERAGRENPRFLDPRLFLEAVLPAYRQPEAAAHTGPFVFQFQPGLLRAVPREQFLERLDGFLGALPPEYRYAVEVRNPELLAAPYFQVLNRHRATHVFTHWSWMPPLVEQMKAAAAAGGLLADFFVARLLTPRGISYAEAVDRFQPYAELQHPDAPAREDALRLARRALQRGATAFILANNRFEGCAPRTVAEIGARLVAGLARARGS